MDMDGVTVELVSGMDIMRNLETVSFSPVQPHLESNPSAQQLKDAISKHFDDIRRVDTCLGKDHADLLKRHIYKSWTRRVSNSPFQQPTERIVINPWPESLALKVTSSSVTNSGLFSFLPREIRDIIYDYALSVSFSDDREMCDCASPCNCAKDMKKCSSGLGMLQTCTMIYQECLPRLYQQDLFSLSVGYQREWEEEGSVAWIEPAFSVHLGVERQVIPNPPQNILHLVRKLEVNFVNDTLLYDDEHNWPFVECTERYQNAIKQVCDQLKNCTQFQLLDITLSFGCKYADIEYMERLLDPFKMLRGIKEPHVTVHGYEHGSSQLTWQYARMAMMPHVRHPDEPRWALNEDFAALLEWSMTLAHEEILTQTEEYEVFMDCSQVPKSEMKATVEEGDFQLSFSPSSDENEMMKAYLRDVYNTDDLDFLNGNMPARWQRWLKKKYREKRALYWNQKNHAHLVQHPRPLASTAWVIDSTSENKGLRWVPENESLDTTNGRDAAFHPNAS